VHGQKDSSELRELIGKCPLMLAMILVAVPKYTKGKLTLVAKNVEQALCVPDHKP